MDLTRRQSQVLNFIKKFRDKNGYPPTRVEIAKNFGFASPNAAEDHIKVLVKKGAIKTVPNVSRGIVVLEN